ncbi:MAG: hypothetical protein O3A20_03345 [Planctomycetota bacterium]|nr:hypothetical protein [Planctomycetota bacterium]
MKTLAQRLIFPAALAVAALGSSCAVPLLVGAVGGLVGVWVYDDFSDDRAEIMLNGAPDRVFAAAESVIKARSDVADLKVVHGSQRITFTDTRTKLKYVIMVMIVPGSPDYATLRVYAAEMGFRGRADEAKALAEAIVARV